MEKIRSNRLPVDFFVSNELKEQWEAGDALLEAEMNYDQMLTEFREEYKVIADLYSQITGNNKHAVLAAHGDDEDGRWVYYDEGNKTVQGWINSVSGKYSLLVLMVCNPGQYLPSSKKSLILFANDALSSTARKMDRECNVELYVPKKGVVDSYCLEHLIKELKSQLKS